MRIFFTIFLLGLGIHPVMAASTATSACPGSDRACLFTELEQTTALIPEPKWRDIGYRELAKLLAADGKLSEAIAFIPQIISDDTKALTIRGIGMAAATRKLSESEYETLFKSLALAADKISEEKSKDIAYTYIAMSQSSAGQDVSAIKTAQAMTNPALKHKALGEIAEVQAGRKDAAKALATLKEIDSDSYRNKASRTVALLLVDQGLFDDAAKLAHTITNPTLKAETIQYIITKQTNP